jgi:hypothetical protein
MKLFSYRDLRVLLLLIILTLVAIYTQEQRLSTTSWYQSIPVVVFPINGDNTTATENYISKLKTADFKGIDAFFSKQGKRYKLTAASPTITRLGSSINSEPPAPPADRSNTLAVMFWSLQLRYWAYQHTPDSESNSNRIRLYVIYHQSKQGPLPHSLGLQKGLIGVIHAYANPKQKQQNHIVMVHEILHTVVASDKYDHRNQPIFPIGYAKPQQKPLYPQRFAEIMAGRKALSKNEAEMPYSLRHVTVGPETAQEINWIEP